MPPSPDHANIARHLPAMAARQPDRPALKIPRGRTPAGAIDYLTLSFAELDAEVDTWAARLAAAGVRRGDRTLVMVRQGLPLIASVFALFKLGAVPVVIDPGMGLKSFLACVARSRPRALVGIPLARLLSRVFRRAFTTVEVRVAASNALTARLTQPGTQTRIFLPPHETPPRDVSRSSGVPAAVYNPPAAAPTAASDLAAILFTSGSTGIPKGVCYEHGMFEAQVRLIRDTYAIQPGEIDLPLLPIFALFNPALGMTTVVPEIDPRHPARIDPARIVQAILQENVTNSFGSPTLWRIIGEHCRATHQTLPSLRRVLCAGAPVPQSLWESSRAFLSNGVLHSPYGATEALPVATISSHEIARVSGSGACVGRPITGAEVKIIALTDAPIATLADARELPAGQIGEIIVRGPMVTQTYDAAPEATALAKIQDISSNPPPSMRASGAPDSLGAWSLELEASAPRSGAAWHRMGDCGYLDADRRLWFCGRKVERVETPTGPLFTEPCEQVFRAHPQVIRCALVGLGPRGQQRPAIVVEGAPASSRARRTFARELRLLALANPLTSAISLFYFHPRFPVDVRHNAKIHRLALARWAARTHGYESDPKR